MRYTFTPAQPSEWLSLDTAASWLDCSVERVKHLVQTGKIRFRTSAGLIQVDSSSVDKLVEDQPVQFSSQPQTFTKVNGTVFEELGNGKFRRIQ